MVGYECIIHQRINYILERLYFKGNSQSMRTIPKPNNSTKNKRLNDVKNNQENYNKYNYDQVLSEKYTETSSLSQRSEYEILNQKFSYKV